MDYIITDLTFRFQSHNNIAKNLCKLLPRQLKDATSLSSDLQETVNFYKDVIPEIESFDFQLEMWVNKWDAVKKEDCPAAVVDVLEMVDPAFMPTIHALLHILATLPVTTCAAERSFSSLKYIKNYLRSTMSEDRLTGLALLYIHKDIDIDINDVVNSLAAKNRRLVFV